VGSKVLPGPPENPPCSHELIIISFTLWVCWQQVARIGN